MDSSCSQGGNISPKSLSVGCAVPQLVINFSMSFEFDLSILSIDVLQMHSRWHSVSV